MLNTMLAFALFSGASFEAVEAVASLIAPSAEIDVFEAASSLADKSLIRQVEQPQG